MNKSPPAKLTVVITLVILIILSLQIPVALAGSPHAEIDKDTYYVSEGENPDKIDETVTLSGTGSENYVEDGIVWKIDGEDYGSDLDGESTLTPTFLPPKEVDGNREVTVKLKVWNENDVMDEDKTTVKIKDELLSRPNGPYEVVEGDNVTLYGEDSSGGGNGLEYTWTFKEKNFSKEAGSDNVQFSSKSETNPKLQAPMVTEDGNVKVRLVVDNGTHVDSETTKVEIKDQLVAKPDVADSMGENENILLKGGESSGADGGEIDNYFWTRAYDPTDNADIDMADKENARFFAPEEVNEDKTIKVRLRVSQDGESDSEIVKIKVRDKLQARPDGPYRVVEGGSVPLDGADSSGYIDNYEWGITDDPTGGARLVEADTDTPTFLAEGSVKTSQRVTVELTVSDENDKAHSKATEVKVKNRVVAEPDGPYKVVENQSISLDGTNSEGDDLSFKWKIIEDPTGEAYLTSDNSPTPAFHALDGLENDKTVELKLTVTDGENDSSSETFEVIIKDALVARPNGPYEVLEDQSLTLDGTQSSGDIKRYNWSITEDPTNEAKLTKENSINCKFHAPEQVNNPVTVKVKLKVSNDSIPDSDYKTTNVKVIPPTRPPLPPENLETEGVENPSSVKVPKPTLSSKYVVPNDTSASRIQIQVGTSENGAEMWDYTEQNISVTPDDRYEIVYGGDSLEAEQTYHWRTRYYANDTWGSWSTETAQFTMGTLTQLINNGVEAEQTNALANMILQADAEEAATSLADADINPAARVMEEAVTINSPLAGEILTAMNIPTRVDIILEVSGLPETPAKAADLLSSMTTEETVRTVRALITQEKFEELDEIFKKLSSTTKDEIFESETLKEDEKNELYSNLSDEAKENMTYKEGTGLNWFLIGGIAAGAIAVVFALLIFTGWLELGGGSEAKKERSTKGGKKMDRKKKWATTIKKFLKSGKKQAGIKTKMPLRQAMKSVRSTIRELGGENVVGVKEKDGKLYLVRKS